MAESEQKWQDRLMRDFFGGRKVEADVKEEEYVPTYVQRKPKKGEDSEGRAFVEVVVDETLEKKEFKLDLGTVKEGFSKLKKNGIEAISDDKEIIISEQCGFVHAVYLAFTHHIPLCFGPDDLWNLIIQGVSIHIAQNAEELRDMFVDFDGKKMLMIRRDHFVKGSPRNDWAGCFEEWSKLVTDNIGEANAKCFIPKFSTTGALEKALHELSLMDAMKSYFRYGCCTMCGISQVKLMGTLEDWQTLRKMVSDLRKYDLDWWMDYVEPVIDEIINTYQGKVDKKFWYTIYKEWSTYGSGATDYVTGWVTHFFPYLQKKKRTKFWTLQELQGGREQYCRNTRASITSVPNGVTQTPFTWYYYQEEFSMNIYGGFAGCEMDGDYVRPVLAWAVGDDADASVRKFVKKTAPIKNWDAETVAKWLQESDSCMKKYIPFLKKLNVLGEDLLSGSSLIGKVHPWKGPKVEVPDGFDDKWQSFRQELDKLRKFSR